MKLISPDDPNLKRSLPKFDDEQLKDYDIKDRKELTDKMFEFMSKVGGIGLTANQVGMNLNVFTIGGHPSLENGLKIACFNPIIVSESTEHIMMKEGCLSFPFLFLSIKRPRKVVAKYEDENGELKEARLDGMMSRVFQHEYDHTQGKTMLDKVSKFKYNQALKKAHKLMKKNMREVKNAKKGN